MSQLGEIKQKVENTILVDDIKNTGGISLRDHKFVNMIRSFEINDEVEEKTNKFTKDI